MRKLWLELVDYNSAISLSGESSIVDTSLVPTGSTDSLHFARLSGGVKITDLAGLGCAADISASYVEPFGYVETKNEISQPSPSGNINFVNSSGITPYARYSAFIRLVQGRRVRLRYNPDGGFYDNASMMDGSISKLLKGEVKAGRLECPFEFRGLAPFYLYATRSEKTAAANTMVTITPGIGELSGYRNAYTLSIKINTTSATSINCQIYDSNTTPVAQLGLNDELVKDDIITWSSDPEDPKVTLNGADEIIAGKVDLSKKVFGSLPSGTIKFNSTVPVKVTSTYKAYQWSV